MMRTQSSSFRRAVFAVIGFLGVLLLSVCCGAYAFITNHNLQNEFEEKTHELDDLQRQVDTVRATKGSVPIANRLTMIGAPTETIAASDLHKTILTSIQEGGASVRSIQAEVTNEVVDDGSRRITALMVFDGSMEALQKVLFRLETAVPFIFVDAMTIQPAPTSAAAPRDGENVRVTLGTSSYWKNFDFKAGR